MHCILCHAGVASGQVFAPVPDSALPRWHRSPDASFSPAPLFLLIIVGYVLKYGIFRTI